ncbi:MAG: 4-(cytidine 5'-diphospho)-2-C-methyl-D-erythritol kinase [Acidobacteria bacterium]|nr:4-(cytidine 5'-diphospho)-2-C-methyl-D-erythritol kinase [Acidobacteriota bacterium]
MLKLPSFAKINWTLRILGKRPDGYHEVATVLQSISLCDELVFHLRDDNEISLSCDDPEIPVDDSNLIVRAARALSNTQGADIKLLKKIPAKGGLGGGSSNAAITLLALNALWRLGLGVADLREIGSGLGADVPFFFEGGTAQAAGTGTEVAVLSDLPRQYLIVVTPNASVSTANAYEALNARSLTTFDPLSILASSFTEPFSGDNSPWPLHNDFEGVIFEIEPEIRRAKLALLEAGARNALLAGSGSSVFGIFTDEAARDQALRNLRCETGWRVFACHTLSRGEYCQAISTGA